MTVLDQPPAAPAVSERLVEPLRIVAGRARTLAWFHALFQLAALCAAVWLVVVLILGSSLRVPVWASVPLTLAGWAVVIVGGYRILRKLFRRRGDMASAALMADAAMPDSQERISSALELSQETNPSFRGSPELVAVLMRQAEHHADTMDPGQIISGREVMRWVSAAGGILLVWAALLAIFTPNMLLGMQRMFTPWNAAAPLPGPVVDVTPGDYILAQGAKLEVTVEVKPADGISLDTGNGAVASATLVRKFISPAGGSSPEVVTSMDPTGPRTFRLIIPNVQQSFTYSVTADGGASIGKGQSKDFTVTVQSRPAVADVELLYSFPKYTGLNDRTEHSRDGNVEALTGTKVHMTVHATEPLKTARLLIGDDGTDAITPINLTLVPSAEVAAGAAVISNKETLYAGDFTIDRSTQYHINLVNQEGRDNADAQARTIRARPDNPPTIAITLPSPKDSPQRVRPDDTVPMKFVATDDFGLSKVDAVVQVDARAEIVLPVAINVGDSRIAGDWELNLADILKASPGTGEPKTITYRFRATDNRDPNPQSASSAAQILSLDKAAAPLAQRLDQQAAKDMAAAVTQAVEKLRAAQATLDDLKKSDKDAALSTTDRQKLLDAQKALADADQLLRQAADQADATRLSGLAQQFREVADQSVKRAEEDVVKAGLAADQPQARRDSQASAMANTQDALNKLQQIANQLKTTSQDQPLAQSLERLSKDQQALADALAKTPGDPKLLDQQKQLQGQLDKLIKDNPQLQKPAAQSNQPRVDDLLRKLDQIQQAQQPIGDQLNNVRNADNSADAARQLSQQQEQLNKDIKQFSQQQDATLKQAGAKPPEAGKLDAIPKKLFDNKLADAAKDETAAATALDQAAAKLDAAKQKADQSAPARTSAAQQADKDVAAAKTLQEQVQKLGQDIQQAKAQGQTGRPSDPVNKEAAKEADAIKQAAQQMAQHLPTNSAARNAANDAAKSATDAKTATNAGDVEKAQQQLSNAANQLAQAAQMEQNTAAGGTMQNSPEAAEQARALAERQRALADQTAALAKSQQEASDARAKAAATAEQQRQIADRIADAAKDAQNLQQQTQGPAPDLAARAAQAQQALQQAADAQRQAAQAARGNNPADAADKQAQAADKVAAAQEALTGQPRAAAANNPPQNQTPGQPTGNTPKPPAGDNQVTAQNPPQQPGQNAGQNPGQTAAQNPGQLPGQNAGQNAAQNPGQNPGQNQTPTAAQNAGQNPGQQPGQNPGQAAAQNSGQNPGQTAAQNPGQQNAPNNSAAQSVQAARNAQSQAINGNAAAAQEAADQLAQASRNLMNNGQQTSAQGQNPGQTNPPSQNGLQPGGQQPGQQAGAQPGGQQPGQQAGAQPGGQQPGQQAGAQPGGQQPGQQAGAQPDGQRPGQQAGAQPGGQQPGQQAGAQPGGQQPGQQAGAQPGGQQPGQQAGAQPGGQQAGAQPGGQQPGQQAGAQPGGQQPGQQAGAQPGGQRPGQQAGAQPGGQQPGQQAGAQPGGQQPGGQGISGQSGQNSGQQAGAPPGGQQGIAGQPGGQPGSNGNGNGSGIKITMNGKDYIVPQEVQDVGVAPSDWVKLSPELQDQLLHSAQQPGPPEYRDMIKNYYSRIARMQSQGGTP